MNAIMPMKNVSIFLFRKTTYIIHKKRKLASSSSVRGLWLKEEIQDVRRVFFTISINIERMLAKTSRRKNSQKSAGLRSSQRNLRESFIAHYPSDSHDELLLAIRQKNRKNSVQEKYYECV